MGDTTSALDAPRALAPDSIVGEFRRFGDAGPAYEIIRIVSATEAFIRVFYSGEELNYPISEILTDPIAETVP